MSNTNTGGPAFPFPAYTYPNGEINSGEGGMTLRDYFAAKAMHSMLSDDAYSDRTETAAEWLEIVAKSSYEMADAMLSARVSS